jgi:predicted amidophosphoribosyltransferase
MEKQKKQFAENRVNNKRGVYSFNKNDINEKNILFLDDVITTGSTMLAI